MSDVSGSRVECPIYPGTPFADKVRLAIAGKTDAIHRGRVAARHPNISTALSRIGAHTLVTLQQMHGSAIAVVDATRGKDLQIASTDGALTTRAGVALSLSTADCFPLFLYNESAHLLGALHVGWRGLVGRIIQQALGRAATFPGWETIQTWVYLGVGIRACCYRANRSADETKRKMLSKIAPGVVTQKGGEIIVDLPKGIKAVLVQAGIPKTQIIADERCSASLSELFASHWREGTARRYGIVSMGCLPKR